MKRSEFILTISGHLVLQATSQKVQYLTAGLQDAHPCMVFIKELCSRKKSMVRRLCGILQMFQIRNNHYKYKWSIQTLNAYAMLLSFTCMNILQSENCEVNHIIIDWYMKEIHTGLYCGEWPPWNETCPCSHVLISTFMCESFWHPVCLDHHDFRQLP